MSEQTLHLLEALRARLRATTRRLTLADLAAGVLLTLGFGATLFLLAIAVEAGLWLNTTPRTVLFWVLVLVLGGLFAFFGLLPLLRLAGMLPSPSEKHVATQIGERFPEVSDRLVNLLDLAEGRRSNAPAEVVDQAVRMLGEQVQPVPFEQVETFDRARRVGRLASLPIVGLLVFMIATPTTFFDAAHRLLSPGTAFERPAPFQLSVSPGDVELVRGETFEITVEPLGEAVPRALMLELNNADEELIEPVQLAMDSTGTFRHAVVNVRKSMRYRVVSEPVVTRWFEAVVVERPIVRGLRVELGFPAYTRIPSQRLAPNVGDVTALPGTNVAIDVALSGNDVTEAFLRFADGSLDTLAIEGASATGSFTLREAGTYQVLLRNGQGIENSDPIIYTLGVLTDAFPSVVLLSPEPLAELNEALETTLRLRINDDFGFARLRLFYRLAESRFGTPQEAFTALPIPLDAPRQLDQEILRPWLLRELDGLDLVPGDVIEYYVRVWDNDAVAGYKSAQSAVHRLRLPSLAEQFEQLDETQDGVEREMEDMLRETSELQDQFKELRDELRRKQEGDWEDERQLEQLQERQQQIEERVEQLSEQMEAMSRQMQDNNLVSPETMELYEELQKTMEEINSPELQEALKKLQEAMQQLNLEQMQQSLQDFEFNEEQYQERMERALELFKRLRVQQKLEEAARRAEELAQQQEQLRKKTEELANDENPDGENDAAEQQDESDEGEQQEGEQQEGEQQEGEQQEGEQQEGEQQEGEQQEGEQQEGEQQEGEQQEGEQQEGEQQEGEQQEGEQQKGEQAEQANEQLAEEQERSKEEMEALAKQLRELQEQMQEMRNTPKEQMQQLNDQAEQMPQQMQKNAEQLRENELNDAQQGQQQMQQQLQQMQQQLQQMQSSMQGQQMQLNMAALRRALDDILRLSQQQEGLRLQVRDLAADSPLLRNLAERQVEMGEGLSVVSDTLQVLSRDIPQMSREVQKQAGDALREMGSATLSMSERAAAQASGHQKASMMHLNELALLLSDLLNQMMSGSSGGSQSMQQMIQQMQQMSQQQQQLNQQIQQMLNDMQGNRLSQDMQGRLSQMAEQQEAIRRQLREMARNPEARGKLLGDLNKIAEQMEETIQELQNQQVDRRTVQRQQQILTRLLDAQKSMQQRGKEERREGQQPDRAFDRTSPGELTPSEQADQLRRALIRALESGYAPDFEELIKRYFELLQTPEE